MIDNRGKEIIWVVRIKTLEEALEVKSNIIDNVPVFFGKAKEISFRGTYEIYWILFYTHTGRITFNSRRDFDPNAISSDTYRYKRVYYETLADFYRDTNIIINNKSFLEL